MALPERTLPATVLAVDTYENLHESRTVASLIDHTLLKPEATRNDIVRLCREARDNEFATVCVNTFWSGLAAEEMADTRVKVCTTIGFPLGAERAKEKAVQVEESLAAGAAELDMVINIGALRSGETDVVGDEIALLARLAHAGGAILKVILETTLLKDDEKTLACQLALEGGADFVKTSTGFAAGGATVNDVALLRRTVGTQLGVKASGGIRDLAALRAMVEAGASRIGTSAGVQIVEEAKGAQPKHNAGGGY